ncbi:MAG: hypothetical protein IPH83_08980 [Gammaproteobacteria bacterium]|nr:hypothetical protein [Gammaproteobacteria bacterium]
MELLIFVEGRMGTRALCAANDNFKSIGTGAAYWLLIVRTCALGDDFKAG